jgi:hypothetical protein
MFIVSPPFVVKVKNRTVWQCDLYRLVAKPPTSKRYADRVFPLNTFRLNQFVAPRIITRLGPLATIIDFVVYVNAIRAVEESL